jgi:hypothetical protein
LALRKSGTAGHTANRPSLDAVEQTLAAQDVVADLLSLTGDDD